jgi:hypothetical protein
VKAQASVGIQILMKCNVRWQPNMVRGFLISDIPQNERNKHVDTSLREKWRSFLDIKDHVLTGLHTFDSNRQIFINIEASEETGSRLT